jgi:Retinal pigment epithelial membrane protein
MFRQHTINAFEDNGHIVIDISCYKNPNMLYCMNIDALQVSTSFQNGAMTVERHSTE